MTSDPMSATPAMSSYPIRFDVQYQENHSRLLLFVRWILAIPHFLILYALGSVASIITFIAFFAILFTKKYPRGLFDFVVNIHRWQANVNAYLGMLRDEYPPFSWDAGQYPITYEADYPETMARFAPLYKWLLAIPNIVVFFLFAIVAIVLWVVAWFAILFTGKFPKGIFDFLVKVHRWGLRLNAYVYLLTDTYPPFNGNP
ncbi:MAG: DUF4389 domain-containing protein [Chloroflexota bacterium]